MTDLIDRSDSLKNYGQRFVTFTGGRDQDHPQEKEMQKGKMVGEKALHISVKQWKVYTNFTYSSET